MLLSSALAPSSSSGACGFSVLCRGSSASVLMIPICFYIGTITIFSVSFENIRDAAVNIMHVNIVVANWS
jgi:hypothetical protein